MKTRFCLVLAGLLSLPVHAEDLAMIPAPSLNTHELSARFPSPFDEGEDFRFAIRWGAITGGYATLSVPDIQEVNGIPAYHLVSEAHSTGMVDKFYHVNDRNEAWLDQQVPRSFGYTKKQHEGNYRAEEVVTLDHTTQRFHFKRVRYDKDKVKEKEGPIPTNVLDVLSSLYYVRALPLEVGKSFTMDVQSDDKVWPLVVDVHKRETIKTKAGKFDCYRVEPKLRGAGLFIAKGKKMEVWITADERRMPVLMRCEIFIGHVSAELVKYKLAIPRGTFRLTANPVTPAAPESN